MTARKNPVEPLKLLLTKTEAAYALGISPRSLDYLIADKVIATRRIGRRVLIPVGALRRYTQADHTESIRRSAKSIMHGSLYRLLFEG